MADKVNPVLRGHHIDIEVDANIDLTKFSTKRFTITHVGDDTYRFRSSFKVWSCERHKVLNNFMKRRGCKFYFGPASTPYRYEF